MSGITQASPAVITTSAAHNFNTGDKVKFDGILGMVELNTGVYYYARVLTVDTFEIYADNDSNNSLIQLTTQHMQVNAQQKRLVDLEMIINQENTLLLKI